MGHTNQVGKWITDDEEDHQQDLRTQIQTELSRINIAVTQIDDTGTLEETLSSVQDINPTSN